MPINRYKLLSFPLDDLALNTELRKADFAINEPSKTTRFPVRALRYWWVFQFIQNMNPVEELTILDMGVDHGQMARYYRGAAHLYPTNPTRRVRWLGLDWRSNRRLLAAGYDAAVQCDFDQGLPLADRSVDVVVCLHVMEHLPRPAFAMQEISRVLKPGGRLLAGSPTAPAPAAFFIERWLRKRLREGKVAPGGHIHSLSPWAWRRGVALAGLRLEFMSGGYFFRSAGFFLENHASWIRLNLLWGATFPSLGSEIYLCAVKPA